MLLTCRKNFTPLQRRTTQLLGTSAILAVLTNFSDRHLVNPLINAFPWLSRVYGHSESQPVLLVTALAALSAVPVLLAIWAVGRYLRAEPDEFIRSVAIQALLWAFAITMLGDAIFGPLTLSHPGPFPLALINSDIFLITLLVAFRLGLRRYQ